MTPPSHSAILYNLYMVALLPHRTIESHLRDKDLATGSVSVFKEYSMTSCLCKGGSEQTSGWCSSLALARHLNKSQELAPVSLDAKPKRQHVAFEAATSICRTYANMKIAHLGRLFPRSAWRYTMSHGVTNQVRLLLSQALGLGQRHKECFHRTASLCSSKPRTLSEDFPFLPVLDKSAKQCR